MHIAECACYFIPDHPQNSLSFYCPVSLKTLEEKCIILINCIINTDE